MGNFDPFYPGSLDVNPPCFVTGTMIATPDGPRPVETLKAGDLILTVDRGAVPLRPVLSTILNAARQENAPQLRPIRITRGALGAGLPDRDLLVSPQHRILVGSRIADRMFGTALVLVAAKQLLQLSGIDIATDLPEFSYFHLIFDRHEIIYSNGAPSESLYPGPEAMRGLTTAARQEIYALFPQPREAGPEKIIAARKLVSGRMGRKLAIRHLQNRKPLMTTA
ncbi:Hint domain-containing protein [uncultured Paracoccus sp.]|uniref:Hint domain-containing protein n=1 Tax=uncultured Paracoccus sp. TaxID=189685 RepID=UPI00343F146C